MKADVYDSEDYYIGSASPKFQRGQAVKYNGETYRVRYRYLSVDEVEDEQPWEYRLDGIIPIISEQNLEPAS